MGATTHGFALETANIVTEDVLRGEDIALGDWAVGQKVVIHDADELACGGTADGTLEPSSDLCARHLSIGVSILTIFTDSID